MADNLDEVLDLLEQHFNVVLPEDTDDDNLMDRLHTALLTAGAHLGTDKEDDPSPNGANTMVADPAAAGAAALSLEMRSTIAWAENMYRQGVATRLRALLDDGRCQPAEFKTRQPQSQAVKLSLDRSGVNHLSDLEKWIESREAVPKGTFWDPSQRTRMSATAASAPSAPLGEMSEEESDEVANWALGRKKK